MTDDRDDNFSILTPVTRRPIESSAEMLEAPAERIVYQHTVLCQTAMHYRDPGDEARPRAIRQPQFDKPAGCGVERFSCVYLQGDCTLVTPPTDFCRFGYVRLVAHTYSLVAHTYSKSPVGTGSWAVDRVDGLWIGYFSFACT